MVLACRAVTSRRDVRRLVSVEVALDAVVALTCIILVIRLMQV
jgi:hypothetical protein